MSAIRELRCPLGCLDVHESFVFGEVVVIACPRIREGKGMLAVHPINFEKYMREYARPRTG